MKIKKLLFLSLFLIIAFLFIPNTVNAAEIFIKYEIIVEEPIAGEVPTKTANVIYSNNSTEIEYNVDILWFLTTFDENGIIYNELSNTDVIENDKRYLFDLTSESYDKITSDFSNNGYSKEDNIKNYINDVELGQIVGANPRDIQDFYVGGVTESHMYLEEPIVGQKVADTTIKFVLKTLSESKEFIVSPGWEEIDGNNVFFMDSDDVFKAGKYYNMIGFDVDKPFISGSIDEFNELAQKTDHRTKNYLNDNIFGGREETIFGPLVEKVKITENFTNIVDSMSVTHITKGSEYSTVLFADIGYELPEMVYVLIDGNELSSTSYSFDKTTGELIIPAERITGNITIIAKAIPKTYKVVFDANEGTFKDGKTLTIEKWENGIEYTLEEPTRAGYRFLGFFTKTTGGTKLEYILAEEGIIEDTIFYAQWEENSSEDPSTTGGEDQPDNNDNNTGNTNTGVNNDKTSTGNNPQTSDDILFFVGMFSVAILGVIVTTKLSKYYKTK